MSTTYQESTYARYSEAVDELKRVKLIQTRWIATGLLVLMTALYAASVAYGHTSAAWPFIGAFAEAAMVGALADWFAVSALFRHPLGIPLPHTAIIPKNKDRIADNLGDFVQGEFFSTDRIQHALGEINPVERMATWLAHAENADKAASVIGRLLVFVLDAVDHDALRTFLKKVVNDRFISLDLSTLAGNILQGLTRDNRHQALLDQILHGANEYLNKEEVKEKIAGFLKDMIPALFDSLKDSIANIAIDKLLKALAEKLDEVNNCPDHPLREWFGLSVQRYVNDLKRDPELRHKIRFYQEQIARNDELAAYVDGIWQDMHDWLKRDLSGSSSLTLAKVSSMSVSLGASLLQSKETLSAINEQIMRAIPGILDELRPRIGGFISSKMKDWKDHEIVGKLELNIGRDLQFIRLNGTLVGGLIGLLIHTITVILP